MLSLDELESRFDNHPVTDENLRNALDGIRAACKACAEIIDDTVIDSREKSVALTKIEEAMMWATASVARTQEINS